MAAASLHNCASATLYSQLLSVWNKRFAARSSARPRKRDAELQDSFDSAVSSLTELVRIGIIDPQVIRFSAPAYVIRPSTRLLVSYASSWSFEQNKRTSSLLFACRNPSPLLLSVRNKSNGLTLRHFRTRAPSAGIGTDRDAVNEEPASNQSHSEQHEKERENVEEKVLKLSVKLDDVKGNLSIDEQSLAPEERDRVRIAFADGYLAASKKPEKGNKWKFFSTFKDALAFVLMIVVLLGILDSSAGSPFRRALIGGSNEVHPEEIEVSFDDVKGVEEAKQELAEVVQFLKDPEKIAHLGGKLPKGVLLVGPPGTGKTLLARAVAGEAGVPFFHASGPEFDEVFVGQGARRVRDLFSQAKLRAPCVVFIDEIDSVGQKRTNSAIHPYANQTVNQLLTEMDGFHQNEGVIVIGATNRREELDKALLRPGRFDVEVTVPAPDLKGREELFDYYLSKIKKSGDVSVHVLARNTTGFTGADIENMINQAALRAAIDGCSVVTMAHMEYSRDKVIMGPARKSRIPDEETNRNTAVHEAGHTLVCFYTKDATPLHKVTIISRGASLGHTAFIPDKENYSLTKSQMLAQMDVAMGGRVAEEMVFGSDKVTSGASNDLKGATDVATNMVKFMGMSEKVGVRTFHSTPDAQDISSSSSEAVDSEIRRLLQESYDRAKSVLKTHQNELKLLSEALLRYETLDADDVRRVIEGKEPRVAVHKKHLLDLSTGHERLPRIPQPHSPHPFKL